MFQLIGIGAEGKNTNRIQPEVSVFFVYSGKGRRCQLIPLKSGFGAFFTLQYSYSTIPRNDLYTPQNTMHFYGGGK